jgi:hypothetical protein
LFSIYVSGQDRECQIPVLEVTNEILVQEIIKYVSEVNTPSTEQKFPYITISILKSDTVEYLINYFISPDIFILDPIAFFFKMDDSYVPVVIKGAMFKNNFFFKLKESDILELSKIYFPEDYEYYIKNKEFPIPPTARDVVWILTFKNGKLVEKREIAN